MPKVINCLGLSFYLMPEVINCSGLSSYLRACIPEVINTGLSACIPKVINFSGLSFRLFYGKARIYIDHGS